MAGSTLVDVAQTAGVSLATASRVLNGSARKTGDEIAKRVRSAAETLDYIPNARAQSLVKATSGLIGLIVHDIADPYFSTIARGVQDAARSQQKTVLLAATNGTPEEERAAVATFAAHRVDSIVFAGSRTNGLGDQDSNAKLAAELDRYCRNGGRVGVIGYPIIGATMSEGYEVVPIPNEELAAGLANKLAIIHPREFLIMAAPPGHLASDDRIRGFRRGLAESGRPSVHVVTTNLDRDGGYAAGLKLAHRIKRNRSLAAPAQLCVLAATDLMAVGALTALVAEGIQVPREVMVAGFDGIDLLQDLQPRMPTVALPLKTIGQIAAGQYSSGEAPPVRGRILLEMP